MKAMKVDNVAFLVKRLGADMPVTQQYRELNQNAIEAIARRRGNEPALVGRIVWDVDWEWLSQTGQVKLAVSDNGDGMTRADMNAYLNRLAVRGANGNQGIVGNFGVGAKIAALARNPEGLVYKSTKRAKRSGIRLRYNERSDEFGIDDVDVAKASGGEESGTFVTLLGTTKDENTCLRPEGVGGQASSWLIRYLNTRYFRLPAACDIRVRRFPNDSSNWPNTPDDAAKAGCPLEVIRGMKRLLDDVATSAGTVDLGDCDVHWWLMDDLDAARRSLGWRALNPGHVGLVFQDEIYVLKSGAAARRTLAAFGIHFGSERVVLHVEPKAAEDRVLHCDTARTRILVDGVDLEEAGLVDAWGARFKAVMPEEISRMMQSLVSSSGEDDARTVKDRLKGHLARIRELINPVLFRRAPGPVRAAPSVAASPRDRDTAEIRSRDDSRALMRQLATSGLPATPVSFEPEIPDVVWVSVANGLRQPDERPEMAAWIDGDALSDTVVKINGDFRGYRDLMRFCIERFAPGASDDELLELKALVQDHIALQLVETVIAVRNLHDGEAWDRAQINQALSPGALTGIVLSRSHVVEAVAREYGERKLEKAA